MQTLRSVAIGLVVGSGALVCGCSTALPPDFRVVEAELTGTTGEGYVVTFTLEGTNPNDFPLPLEDVTYALDRGAGLVFTGTRSAEATLPAMGSQFVRLPVAVGGDSAGALGVYTLSGSVVYQLPGAIAELFFDNDLRRPSVVFEESGELTR